MSEPSDNLADTLAAHQIALPPEQISQLEQYCRLVWEWNDKLNLTRHTDFELFVTRDLLDTLELSKLLKPNEEVLDVGTGGGVPGVPLAILRPDLKVTLCDSVQKKARAVEDIVRRLKLPAPVFAGRAEQLLEDERYDTAVCRAVGPLWKICHWFNPHWAAVLRVLAIKGPKWVEERGEARHRGYLNKLELRKLSSYPRPGADNDSVILQLWPKGREIK